MNSEQINSRFGELFLSIQAKKPLCKEKHKGSFIVWSTGNGKPIYTHCKNGIGFLSYKEYDCYHLDKNEEQHRCKKSRGKLLISGKYGLGVPYNIACVLWEQKIIDSLPLKT